MEQLKRKNRKFQIIKTEFSNLGADSNRVSVETDKQYKKVTGIFAYTDPDYNDNINVELDSPLKINNVEQFPENFDLGLLFPAESNKHFTAINEDAAGSLIEFDFATPDAAGTLTIILILENPVTPE